MKALDIDFKPIRERLNSLFRENRGSDIKISAYNLKSRMLTAAKKTITRISRNFLVKASSLIDVNILTKWLKLRFGARQRLRVREVFFA